MGNKTNSTFLAALDSTKKTKIGCETKNERGFKRERVLRYSKHVPVQEKNVDSRESVLGSVILISCARS